jgi:hypothetical protein
MPTLPASKMTKQHSDGVRAWVLVTGTGLEHRVPQSVLLAAEETGRMLAHQRFGLVTGGWHGVDYIVGKAFADELARNSISVDNRLVQVIRGDEPQVLNFGMVVRTHRGPSEWLDAQNYADALVMIGGIGGTYMSFLAALHKGLPRFPLGGTGGDAERAFQQMSELWDLIPNPGASKRDFDQLATSVMTRADAQRLADHLGPLILAAVGATTPQIVRRQNQAGRRRVFISYHRDDSEWMIRLRTVMRPVERTGMLESWSDVDISAGTEWEAAIGRQIELADVAVLLVTSKFLASRYLAEKQLPYLLQRRDEGKLKVLWVLVGSCFWEASDLAGIQAAADPARPLELMEAAESQIALVRIVRELVAETR